MNQFFLHDGQLQTGPFTIDELKQKGITKDTSVWAEGMESWTKAGEIEALKDIFKLAPPPFKKKVQIDSSTPAQSTQQYENSVKPKTSNSFGRMLIVLAAIVVLVLIGIFVYNKIEEQEVKSQIENEKIFKEDSREMVKNNILDYVKVTVNEGEYTAASLGGISNLKVSVANETEYLLEKVVVRVVYIKPNGEVWNSRNVDFNLIKPNTITTIKVGDTNRGVKIKYEIQSIRSSALGL